MTTTTTGLIRPTVHVFMGRLREMAALLEQDTTVWSSTYLVLREDGWWMNERNIRSSLSEPLLVDGFTLSICYRQIGGRTHTPWKHTTDIARVTKAEILGAVAESVNIDLLGFTYG